MRLKIGFLTERLILGFGVDVVVHQHASFLHGQGHDVTVFCMRHEPNVARRYKVFDLSQRAGLFEGSMPRNIVNLAAFCNACPVDVWIVNTPPFYEVVPLLVSPCIAIEHGTPPSKFFSEAIGSNLDASVNYRFRHVFPRLRACDRIHCISRSIQNWLPQSVRAFSDVLYLGCDHYGKARQCAARTFRQSHGVADGEILVLWVGRVQLQEDQQPYKGFPESVALGEEAMLRVSGLKFMIVGRGGDAEADFLRSKGIIACLNLADEMMGTAYAAADIFVNTSKWEGFNLPLLEAQFQGVPVIAFNDGPHPEVCRNGETGILVGDAGSMLKALLAMAEDSSRRAQMGTKSAVFAEGFSWAKSCVGLETAIEAATAVKPSALNTRVRRFMIGAGAPYFVMLDTYRRYGFAMLVRQVQMYLRARLARFVAH